MSVQSFILILICVIGFSNVSAQQLGKIKGSVTDQFDAVVVGVEVNLIGETSPARKTLTNQTGNFFFNDVSPGKYTLTVKAAGFKTYENPVEINQGSTLSLDLKLEVALDSDIKVNVDPDKDPGIDNANQIILKDKALDVLPDDPEALLSSLQALTGGGQTSLDGGAQIYVDGFAGTVPPKSSILEVRINQNQLNAEFDRAGFGRIDIITKPGTQKFTGSAYFNVSDDALVARNPFVPVREPYQTRLYGFNISKALKPNKLAFTLDVQKRDEDTNTVVNSLILNQIFEPVTFSTAVPTPVRLTVINPRFDIKLNEKNYLIARYSFTRTEVVNRGVGDFFLPERGYPIVNDQNVFQITESSILNPKVSNEFRFQFVNDFVKQSDENSNPGVSVQDAFVSGGSGVGLAFSSTRRWEIQNYTNAIFKGHTFRFGVRLRGVSLKDSAIIGYNGLFSFTGRIAPQLNSNNEIILDQQGNPILTQISSLESYRRTLLFQNAGLSPQEIRRRGGGASLFSITVGNPEAKLNQIDIGLFFQDEWRIRPNLSVGVGLRYENQQNISSHLNFAPRLFFAWAPGNKPQPDLIIRGGFGIFYDRLTETPSLLSRRFDGITQIRYFITDSSVLDSFPNLPTPSTLANFAGNQSQTRVDENLRAPYSATAILNIEKTLPFKIQGYIYAYAYRTYNVIRQRNINAPLPGTFVPPTTTNPGNPGIRPNPNLGEIFFYESSGNFSLNQATFGIRKFFKNGNFLFSSYVLGHVKSDSEGLPADSYNLRAESADASFDVRHRFIFGGSFTIPKIKVLLSPFLIASSGRPFNITTGIDNNGDRIYTDRPAFATNTTLPENLRNTEFGSFDLRPLPGQELIPRNYGRGSAFFSVNLNLSRTFDLNPWKTKKLKANQKPQANQNPAESKSAVNQYLDRAYKLTLSVQIQNLFNRTNLDVPNGNLSSPLFGQSVRIIPSFGSGTPAGFNRRVEFGARLNF
jgi:hypothetical protein